MVLAIGFDPVFIDTLVALKSKDGKLIDELPKPGHHFRNATISRIAGGNGVNISYVLNKINVQHKLVIPSNDLFMNLLEDRGIRSEQIEAINTAVGETVGVTWKPGEIQLNDPRSVLGINQWSETVDKYWKESPIKLFINWGLNYNILEWASIQWLSCSGWSIEELTEERNHFNQALEVQNNSSLLLLEPGSIREHHERNNLLKLINSMSKINDHTLSTLCANEEEENDFESINFQNTIIHTSQYVRHRSNDKNVTYDVPRLNKEPVTFVGAGDSFLAGLIQSLLEGRIDITNAIITAQNFLIGQL